MNLQDAISRVHNLTAQMNEQANQSAIAAQRYQGHMALFQAAAASGQESLMEEQRLALHTSLDVILDTGAIVQKLQKDILYIQQNYPDL